MIAITSSPSGFICAGQTMTLTASGANTYTWNTSSTSHTISVSPATSTSYTVNGLGTNGCIGSAIRQVSVNALPNLSVSASPTLICKGESATLTVTGANSYTWSNSSTGNSITVSPSVTTTYTVEGTGSNGCSKTATYTQSVNICTGLETLPDPAFAQAYPNPFINELYIDAPMPVSFTIVNVLGVVMYSGHIERTTEAIDTSQFPSGVYYIRLSGQDKRIIKMIRL